MLAPRTTNAQGIDVPEFLFQEDPEFSPNQGYPDNSNNWSGNSPYNGGYLNYNEQGGRGGYNDRFPGGYRGDYQRVRRGDRGNDDNDFVNENGPYDHQGPFQRGLNPQGGYLQGGDPRQGRRPGGNIPKKPQQPIEPQKPIENKPPEILQNGQPLTQRPGNVTSAAGGGGGGLPGGFIGKLLG